MTLSQRLQPNAPVPESQRFAHPPQLVERPLDLDEQLQEIAEPPDATDWSMHDTGVPKKCGAPARGTPA